MVFEYRTGDYGMDYYIKSFFDIEEAPKPPLACSIGKINDHINVEMARASIIL